MSSLTATLMLFPAFFCSYYVVRDHMKWSRYLTAAACFLYTAVSLPLLGYLQTITNIRDNRILLAFFIPFFGIYYPSVALSFGRCLVIYLWAAVFMSFPPNIAYLLEALLGSSNGNPLNSPEVLFIQGALSFSICTGVYIATNRWDARVIAQSQSPEEIWYSWMSIPVLFLAMNIAMIPASPQAERSDKLILLYALFSVCLLLLYIYLTAIFYSLMLEYIHVRDFENAAHIHDIQNLQYRNLQEQMRRDSRARHDFKHTLRVLTRLAASENWKELKQYLNNYALNADNIIVKNYCFSPALNAVLNYYAAMGEENGIATELQVDLPEDLPLDDVEFCSLVGNIMENAIDACSAIPKEKRRFSISIQLKNAVNLYIVSTNSYDGSLADSDGNYESTKPGHKGIGLRSIRETVEKYHGTMRIETDEKEFRLDIVMKVESETALP